MHGSGWCLYEQILKKYYTGIELKKHISRNCTDTPDGAINGLEAHPRNRAIRG